MSFHLGIMTDGVSANEVVERAWKATKPLGSNQEVVSRIIEHFPSAVVVKPGELFLQSDDCVIYINLYKRDSSGDEPDQRCDFVSFAITGGGNPIPEIVSFCKSNNWYLADFQNDSWVDLDNPITTWSEYQRIR